MNWKLSLKTFFVFLGFAALVAGVWYTSSLPVSSKEAELKEDSNDFEKASLAVQTETELTPEIDFEAAAAGAFIEGGKEIFGWESEKRWPIASLTKMMTAVVAFENMPPSEIITMTAEAIAIEGATPSFSAEEKFRLNDLVKAMMISSSNDAAEAIAIHFGREDFIKAMNGKALELKMTETNFFDPTGLSSRNQSTVNDLIRLVEYVRVFEPGMLATTKKTKDTIYEVKTGRGRTITNINSFAGQKGFLGGKTGSTPEAGGNLISVFDIGGEAKTIIVLGAEDKFAETTKIKQSLWQ